MSRPEYKDCPADSIEVFLPAFKMANFEDKTRNSSSIILGSPAEAQPATGTDAPKVRPWVRYWARMFDLWLFGLVTGVVVQIIAPQAFSGTAGRQGFGIVVMFVWVFAESMLLSVIGTTPGKWLFKTRLALPASSSIPFVKALDRSFRVWWRGLGIGIAIVSLFTLWNAYARLTRDRITSWDKDGGFVVTHTRIGVPRTVMAVLCFAAFFALAIAGSVS